MEPREHRQPVDMLGRSHRSEYSLGKNQPWIDSILDQQGASFYQARNSCSDTLSRNPAKCCDPASCLVVVDHACRTRLEATCETSAVYLEQEYDKLEVPNGAWVERRPDVASSDELHRSVRRRRGERCSQAKLRRYIRLEIADRGHGKVRQCSGKDLLLLPTRGPMQNVRQPSDTSISPASSYYIPGSCYW